jgi:hypothetical protein
MDETAQFLKSWKVRAIEVLPGNKGVEVEFGVEGSDPIRFRTRRFGIGKRGARSAALAKFASQAGFGVAEDLFRYVSGLPQDLVGNLFPEGPFGPEPEVIAVPALTCLWPDESTG